MFARVLPLAARKEQGRLADGVVPGPMRVRQPKLRLERSRIEAYRRVCDYEAQPNLVPLPYPEIHFTPLMAAAILSDRFPLSPLGLIHTKQTIAVHAPLRPGDMVDATAELSELRRNDKGYEVDFALRLERDGAPVWSGVTTVLSRSPGVRSKRAAPRPRSAGDAQPLSTATQELTVPSRTGVAFARVAGDWNPHHLWWFTAKPLGYRRPIAHGMWTFARAVTVALRGVEAQASLEASVAFKRPLLMPARVQIQATPLSPDTPETSIAVRDAETGAPHVVGHVRALETP
ncbi:MAG: MaoC/PaaZ C-terminal domain-containing protein [Myxococcota bacterium]